MNDSIIEQQLEELVSEIPGPHSRELTESLQRYEARGVTYVDRAFPIVWQMALGANVWDIDGNCYIDLTSAFGVANIGHTNPYVAAAIADQSSRLIHGMGDVHPTEAKIRLLERLAQITPGDLTKSYLCNAGAEAIEFALKTAYLASGKARVLAFEGAYHGLTLGTLGVIGLEKFRAPFAALLGEQAVLLPFPVPVSDADRGTGAALERVRAALAAHPDIGAILVEPIQGRAGVVVPPSGFLAGLRALADEHGATLIFDEIYTGFCRTGPMFACEHEGVVPDLLCIGKALGNGVPIAAVVGSVKTMDAWQPSNGEALHTSTYLGNPLCCAAALANIDEIGRHNISARAHQLGAALGARLKAMRKHKAVREVRGRGMMWGVELESAAAATNVVKVGLARGILLLQSGVEGNVLTIAPPITIKEHLLVRALHILDGVLAEAGQ